MVKIYLKGKLGRRFGRMWELNVKTVEESIRAIDANTKGEFRKYIIDTKNETGIEYGCKIDGEKVTGDNKDLLEGPCGTNAKLEFYPVMKGSGTAVITELIVSLVVGVVVSAISILLAPSPDVDIGQSGNDVRRDSYLFTGGPQPARQGKPVGLGYGTMRVYPIPISVDFNYKHIKEGSGETDDIVTTEDSSIVYVRTRFGRIPIDTRKLKSVRRGGIYG